MISPRHLQEFQKSCIAPEIIQLNFKSLEEQAPYDYLLYSPELSRTNTGRVSLGTLNRYAHCEHGGWWINGIDVISFSDALWGQFKPDKPRIDESKGKYIKYEAPPKIPTEILALKIPVHIWEKIARRYDVSLPDNYREASECSAIFWKWVIDNPKIPLIISEGAKKAAAILSCSYVAIALPGVRSGYRVTRCAEGEVIGMPSLIPQLQIFANPDRRIYFCFDNDSKRNTRKDVNNSINKSSKLFKKFGCIPLVISWDEKLGKGIDDALFNSSQLGINPEEQFGNFYRSALAFDDWESKKLKELTYPVNQKLNRHELLNNENPNDTLPPVDAQLIALKSPKKTGKTHWISWFTEPLLNSGEKRILLLTHRIQLSTQTADRLGIPYVTEVKDCETKNLLGQGMCIDSLHPNSQAKFNPEYWANSYVIIDEIQQVIWHLLSSSTCVKERVKIINTLKELLRNVIRSGGKIIIADADLNDIAIDFIKGLIGWEINTYIIENEYTFTEPWSIYNFKDKDARRLVAFLQDKLSKGEKHLLCVSGQKAKSRWGSIDLEAYFKKLLPELRILRIDSEAVANPNHPAYGCVSKINEVIKDYDLVIATGTIETGVSIEEKHFDGVWGIFQGVSTTDSVRQFLSRYRVPVPRYIWVKSTGIGFIGNKSTNFKALIASQRKLDKANRNRLIDCGFEETLDGNFEPIALTTWAKLGAIINQGKWKYSEQILQELEAEGHIIFDVDKDDKYIDGDDDEIINLPNENQAENTKLEIDNNRDEQYQKYRENVSTAESLNDIEYEKIQKQQSRNENELLQLRKARLERTYNIEITPNLVHKDDDGWHSQIRLHYYFDVGRKFLKARDISIINSALSNGNGEYFAPDTNKSLLGKRIDALDYLGINRLYQDTRFDKNHSVIQDIFDKCQTNIYSLKLALGIDFTRIEKPIECVQRILNLIGHKMPFIRKEGGRGNQIRIYGKPAADFEYINCEDKKSKKVLLDINNLPIAKLDDREEIFSNWIDRDTQAEIKSSEEKLMIQQKQRINQIEDQWLEKEVLDDIADILQDCNCAEMVSDLRNIYPDYVLKAAAKLLPAEVRLKIGAWVREQNQNNLVKSA
ncbi:MAG: plasmid replication protein, CyRepA1 family [Rivularia sp. (in: cyanobacteria)]